MTENPQNPIHIATVVGARPQFVKCCLLRRRFAELGLKETLIHTGQHYDPRMSGVFFQDMGIREPDLDLGVGSDTHGRQTGRMMIALEEAFEQNTPDWVVVFGDTNSTLAAALVAAKMGLRVAHVESGLRSGNRAMPEEHNRVLTDHLADLLFCHSDRVAQRLHNEKVQGRVVVAGDIMRETAAHFLPSALARQPDPNVADLAEASYAVLTVHRPVNADCPQTMAEILEGVGRLGYPVVFPVHPRTRKRLTAAGLNPPPQVRLIDPVGYLDMLALVARARLVLTDSGGLQKEALFLGTPCVTLRAETEWVETVELGMNTLADPSAGAGEVERKARHMDESRKTMDAKSPAERQTDIDNHFGPIETSTMIARELMRNRP